MTTWQPIKTAPKDGRVKTYMVYAHGMAITATKFKSCWMNKGEEIFPTHWMHLPAPPTEDK